jgi:rubrerythrin
MANPNAGSVFEIAEQMERQGAEFYRKAAETADQNGRTVLLALAQMEYIHERTFTIMRSELTSGSLQPITPEPNSQGALYLDAVASGKIFGAASTPELTGQESIDRIFEIAISLEKDSIVFYQSMKSLVPPGRMRNQLDEIIDQEIGHILELTRK